MSVFGKYQAANSKGVDNFRIVHFTYTSYRLPGRVWTFMENIKDTNYDFTLVLRQMYTEAILREKLRLFGDIYHAGIECTDFGLNESATAATYPITASFMDKKSHETFELRRYGSNCKATRMIDS